MHAQHNHEGSTNAEIFYRFSFRFRSISPSLSTLFHYFQTMLFRSCFCGKKTFSRLGQKITHRRHTNRVGAPFFFSPIWISTESNFRFAFSVCVWCVFVLDFPIFFSSSDFPFDACDFVVIVVAVIFFFFFFVCFPFSEYCMCIWACEMIIVLRSCQKTIAKSVGHVFCYLKFLNFPNTHAPMRMHICTFKSVNVMKRPWNGNYNCFDNNAKISL